MAPHSSTLAWKIPWMDEPRGRCYASDSPPPTPVTQKGNERSPTRRRRRPWPPYPAGETMSSGQQQPPPPRRVTNVGSLLLTPQENESLFTFLGKKCVVSG